jgi:hypothetical protein
MCSFIQQHRFCKQCRSPIDHGPVDHVSCGKPPKKCPGTKKRGTAVRHVEAEECDRCSLEALDVEAQDDVIDGATDEDEGCKLPPTRPVQLGLLMKTH